MLSSDEQKSESTQRRNRSGASGKGPRGRRHFDRERRWPEELRPKKEKDGSRELVLEPVADEPPTSGLSAGAKTRLA